MAPESEEKLRARIAALEEMLRRIKEKRRAHNARTAHRARGRSQGLWLTSLMEIGCCRRMKMKQRNGKSKVC
jgi:hypothetical protein